MMRKLFAIGFVVFLALTSVTPLNAREIPKMNQYNKPLVAHTLLAVMVSHPDSYATVFQSIANEETLGKAKTWLSSQPSSEQAKVKILSFNEFLSSLDEELKRTVKINDYPKIDVKSGLVDLLTYYPNTPFGITFTSGIAFTNNDYVHAQKIYSIFSQDPKKYESIRNENFSKGGVDPINPLGHLKPLMMYDYPR